MVLIAIRIRFSRDDHEAGAILVEPCVHGLIKTREPRGSVPFEVSRSLVRTNGGTRGSLLKPILGV
jgi:hypothetical protein